MTKRRDRLAWTVALSLLAGVALVGGLIVEAWRDDAQPAPSPRTQFFLVALA
ncbi:hypothetical protein [Tsuneonella rigui]|uniref:hypothetical protein n=1 Tax=Tsuneonella rigui TaxID=1708790 RepID=UPI0013DE8C20|nr:hypothetical protein [Tsuneonella rigui]